MSIGFLINEEAVIWRCSILIDIRREMLMFQKLNTPLIEIIENMSYLDILTSNDQIDILGRGGGKKIADKFNLPFLGEKYPLILISGLVRIQ